MENSIEYLKNRIIELEKSEKRFRRLYENSTIGIYRSNPAGKMIFANPKFVDILGYANFDELLELDIESKIYNGNGSRKKFRELLEKEEVVHGFQTELVKKDGTAITILESARAVKDNDGKIKYYEGTIEDITDRVNYFNAFKARDKVLSALSFSTETFLKTLDWQANLNEVLKRLGESLDVSRAYIFQNQTDENGEILASQRYEWVNEGISAEINNPSMQNMSFKTFDTKKMINTLIDNKVFTELTKNFDSDAKEMLGEQDVKSLLLVPIFESDYFWGFIGFDDCKTERVWTDQEKDALKTAGNLFGVAIKRKIFEEELLKAKIKAEESDKLKSNFLAQMSHEIRSPINSILSFSSLLEGGITKDIDDELKVSFEIISSAGKRIIRTIDLILNMSEVQTGTYEYSAKEVDIYEKILSCVIEEFTALAKTKNYKFIVLKNTDDTIINVDAYTVTQIFVNLVDNAFKYTKKGKIELKIDKDKENKLVVSVSDTGIGISEEYLPVIFKPFSQEDQGYTRKFEGNGLGLALVKNYCDMNNADISVESKKNVGSTFTVTFN